MRDMMETEMTIPCARDHLTVFFQKKGAFAMIPCKSTCLMYQEGCHKTCPVWRQQQKKRSEEYRRKLTYLKEYNEICSTVVSQLKRMSCHRTYF